LVTMINGWYGCDVVVGNDPWLVSRAVTDQKACSVWFGVWKYLVVKLKIMVKLTPDLIQQSMQYTNPVRDRELDLRGKYWW